MPIIRVVETAFPPDQAEAAERNWREHCAPIMIRQPGCLSEVLLRNRENRGEYISYSEWRSFDDVRQYLASEDHQEIKRHNRNIAGAKVVVKHYDVVA
jgi:heme-degrading monooxygenase HmoA